MTFEQTTWLIGGVLILIISAICIPLYIRDLKKNTKILTKEELRAWEDELLNDEGQILTTHAQVVDMTCGVNSIGCQSYKQPKAVKHFIIQFKSDNGDILTVPVPEEMYEGFDIGLAGTLTLIDGQVNSFEPDEL